MKKYGHIIWMMLAMLMSMACSSSDDSEQEVDVPETGTPIAFSAQQGEETAVTQGARRAASMTRSSDLESIVTTFRVWAFKNTQNNSDDYSTYQTVIPEYFVHWEDHSASTTTTNTHDWDYVLPGYPEQTIKYWDWNAKAYRFFGAADIVGSNIATGKWNSTNDIYELSFTADAANADDAPYYSKLWFSDGSGPDRLFGRPVLLEFMKPFVKVRFMFTYANTDPAVPKPLLEDPEFRPVTENQTIAVKGKFVVSYPIASSATTESWSISNITNSITSFTVPYTETIYPGGDTAQEPEQVGSYHWETVLPATNQGAFQLTVTINGEDKNCTVPAQYMNWQPGYSYTYIFKVNETGGVELAGVNIGITEWGEGKTDDYILYNW